MRNFVKFQVCSKGGKKEVEIFEATSKITKLNNSIQIKIKPCLTQRGDK